MICPWCNENNLPGADLCGNCLQDLTQLDRPVAHDRIERSLMEDPVRALRPHRPVTIEPTATIGDAVQAMLTHNLGALLVVDQEGKLLGMFSERDLLTKVAGQHEPYAELPVRQFMTPMPETINS